MITSWKRLVVWVVVGVLAMAFTWHVVSWSGEHGKLAMPPDYDDSHSLVEGAVRLLNFQEGGWGALSDEFRERNAHSFLHYYWTGALFALFGIMDAVPYWANAVFVFGVLLAFGSMLPSGLPIIWRFVWMAAFLGVPVCFHLVFDYRSEVTMAALLFMGCACALEWSWGSERCRLWFFATAFCFAMALAMKPVMFPYQLGMLGLCSMVYLASRCVERGENEGLFWPGIWGVGKALALLCVLWGLVLLPSLLHFYCHAQDIFGYILGVAFESDFYKLKEEAQGAQWSYHWLGYSGIWHLGRLNVILAVLLGVGLVMFLIPRLGNAILDARWASLAFLTLGAFGGIAINSVHQPWFGMTFQLLLTASAFSLVAHLFKKGRISPMLSVVLIGFIGVYWLYDLHNRIYLVVLALSLLPLGWAFSSKSGAVYARIFASAGAILVIAYGLTLSGFIFQVVLLVCALLALSIAMRWEMGRAVPFICTGILAMLVWGKLQRAPYHDYVARTIQEEGESGLEWRRSGPQKVFQVLDQHWNQSEAPIIWCANYGWVDGNTVSWEAAKDGKSWKIYNMGTIFGNAGFDPSRGRFHLPVFADFLIVPSPGMTGEIATPYGIHDWNAAVKVSGHWDTLGKIQAPRGEVVIYQNRIPWEVRDFQTANTWLQRMKRTFSSLW